MVLDEMVSDFPGQNNTNHFDHSDDNSYLNLRDSNEETNVDSVTFFFGINLNFGLY